MDRLRSWTRIGVVALGLTVALPAAAGVHGWYLEARTSDVYTGPCFANAEVNLEGQEALLAWRIEAGSWDGVELSGRTVALAVRAEATLGDPFNEPEIRRAELFIEPSAGEAEAAALLSFVRAQWAALDDVPVEVSRAPMRFDVADPDGAASLSAGDAVALATRPLNHKDHLCGNETVYYPPLAPVETARAAVTLENAYQGEALGARWRAPGKRSAFVGTFRR